LPAYAQQVTKQPSANNQIQLITSLSQKIGSRMENYFAALETLAADEATISAVTDKNENKLDELESSYQEQLTGSLKVRIYIRGTEKPDHASPPACGFACIDIIRNAYNEDPPAEALLFQSSNANLTLARKIQDHDGQVIGAIVAHYPFSQLKQEVEQLNASDLYTELRQLISGQNITLSAQGNNTIKHGAAQKIVRIPNSKWLIAIWTPGNVTVDDYLESPPIPWLYITLAIIVLLAGITALIVYHVKFRPKVKSKKKKDQKSGDASHSKTISYEEDDDSPTVIFGGGAEKVDVSKYLQSEDVTDLSRKK
jgi:hypothetical protein